jgi:type III pantothenate kinase
MIPKILFRCLPAAKDRGDTEVLLVFDIGNTQISAGVFRQEKLAQAWRIRTDRQKTVDEYGILCKNLFREARFDTGQIRGVIISSVVPSLTGVIEKMALEYFASHSLLVGPGIKTGLAIRFENPREIGADRIVNAVAAMHFYGAPLIVIDFGTATTFCAIAPNGDYLGGAIVPGLEIAGEALFLRTAKLPRVELAKPKSVIGKNTVNSLQSGLYFGYLGLVESMVGRMKTEMKSNPQVIATGVLADLFSADTAVIDRVDPNLTLEGLRLLYEMNREDRIIS